MDIVGGKYGGRENGIGFVGGICIEIRIGCVTISVRSGNSGDMCIVEGNIIMGITGKVIEIWIAGNIFVVRENDCSIAGKFFVVDGRNGIGVELGTLYEGEAGLAYPARCK